MDLSVDYFEQIIQGLRDQTGSQIKEAESDFDSVKSNPETIIKLIEILNSTVDQVVKQTVIILMKSSFRACSSSLSEEFIELIKSNFLTFFATNNDQNTTLILVNAVVSMHKIIHWEWPEIIDFVFNMEGPLLLTLQLLYYLIIYCFPEVLINLQDKFSQILYAGLTSSSKFDKALSIEIINKVVKLNIFSEKSFTPFIPIVSQILEEVLLRQDDDEINFYFLRFSEDDQFFLFPLEAAFHSLITVLESEDIPVITKESIKLILDLYLINTQIIPNEIIDNITELFQIEVQIMHEILQNQPEDFNKVSFIGILSCLELNPQGCQIALQFVSDLIEEGSNESLCLALIIAMSTITKYNNDIDQEELEQLFQFIFEALGHESLNVRHCASKALTKTAKYFSDFISENFIDVVRQVVSYLESRDDGFAIGNPLEAVLKYADNIDDVVGDVFTMCYECVQQYAPSQQSLEYVGAINAIINRMGNYGDMAGGILQALVELVSSDLSRFYLLLRATTKTMTYLLADEDYAPMREAIVGVLQEGMESSDEEVLVVSMDCAFTSILEELFTQDEIAELREIFKSIAESCYDESGFVPGLSKKLSIALCGFTQTNFNKFDISVLEFVVGKIKDIVEEKDLREISYIFNSITAYVTNLFHDQFEAREILMELFELAMSCLQTNISYTPIPVIRYISHIIKSLPGIDHNDIMDHFIRYLPLLLNNVDEKIEEFQNSIILTISDIMMKLDTETRVERTQQIVSAIESQMTTNEDEMKLNILLVFLQLFTGLVVKEIPEEFINNFKEILLSIINEGKPISVVRLTEGIYSISSFFYYQKWSIIFDVDFISHIFNACDQCLHAEEPSMSQVILMHEHLVSLMCTLSSSFMGDSTPVSILFNNILEVCPITKSSSCANNIYMTLTSLALVMPIEKQVSFMKKLIPAFAIPFSRVVDSGLEKPTIISLGKWMTDLIEKLGEEQAMAIISEILGENRLAYSHFFVFINYWSTFEEMVFTDFEDIDLNSLEVIDLTNKEEEDLYE